MFTSGESLVSAVNLSYEGTVSYVKDASWDLELEKDRNIIAVDSKWLSEIIIYR